MAIYNLGTIGEPRESALSDMSKMLGQVANTYANIQAQKQKNTIALAKFTQEAEDRDRKHGMKIMEDYSMYMGDKDQAEQELFKQTDQYKAVQKIIKRIYPEYIDDRGDIITIPKREIYETHLKKKEFELTQKIASGGTLNTTEQQTVDFLRKNDPKIASSAISNAMQDPTWHMPGAEQEATRSRLVQDHLKMLHRARNTSYSDRGDSLGILPLKHN